MIALLALLSSASGAVPADRPQSDLLGASAALELSSAEELTACDLMRAVKRGIGFASPYEASKAEAEQAALDSSLIWKAAPRDLRCSEKKSRLDPLKGARAIERGDLIGWWKRRFVMVGQIPRRDVLLQENR